MAAANERSQIRIFIICDGRPFALCSQGDTHRATNAMTERFSASAAASRRGFILLAGATAAGWLSLGATSDRMRIVASLTTLPLDDDLTRRNFTGTTNSRLGRLIGGLRQRGWIEGVNIRFEIRSSFGGPDRLKAAIQEILDVKPDVILTGSTGETAAVMAATKTIPIVFATANDPVGNGFVESLAHPGGNVTGFTSSTAEMGGKWLQLIQEATPDLARVGVLFNPATAPRGGRFFLDSIEQEAVVTGMPVVPTPVHAPGEIDEAIGRFSTPPKAAMIALVDSFLVVNRHAVVAAAAKHRVPMIYPYHYFMDAGGLMSYGPTLEVRAADYVDLILRGTRAGDLPVQSPRKYELLINRTVAGALGLKLPFTLLARADEIRE
jgi:putative ABC transport system substrate-binding protein